LTADSVYDLGKVGVASEQSSYRIIVRDPTTCPVKPGEKMRLKLHVYHVAYETVHVVI
jgi:hypothetical protein